MGKSTPKVKMVDDFKTWTWYEDEGDVVSSEGDYFSLEEFIMYTNGLERALATATRMVEALRKEEVTPLEHDDIRERILRTMDRYLNLNSVVRKGAVLKIWKSEDYGHTGEVTIQDELILCADNGFTLENTLRVLDDQAQAYLIEAIVIEREGKSMKGEDNGKD